MHANILEADGITKSFGSVKALKGVTFSLRPGEVMALVGDNGAGKSTVVKVLSGLIQPDEGTIAIATAAAPASGTTAGTEVVTIDSPVRAAELGITTVHQDLAVCDNIDVIGNLFLGRELGRRGWFGLLDEEAMEQSAVSVLSRLAVSIPNVRNRVESLSGGQRQSVAVARSVLAESRVVLLDEPTAALGVAQTRQVLDLILRLKEEGHAVVLISHNLADVFEVADSVTVLRLGECLGTYDASALSREDVVGLMTGARTDIPTRRVDAAATAPAENNNDTTTEHTS